MIPIRVRYDKTAEFRKEIEKLWHPFYVADSVWESINPVTEEMITSGENIPDISDIEFIIKR